VPYFGTREERYIERPRTPVSATGGPCCWEIWKREKKQIYKNGQGEGENAISSGLTKFD